MVSYYAYVGASLVENELDALDNQRQEIDQIDISDNLESRMKECFEEFAKESRKRYLIERSRRFAISAAIFLVILIASLAVLTVSVEAFRMKFFNLFIEKTETHTTVKVEEEIDVILDEELWQNTYWLTHLPDGYQFSSKEIFNETKLQLYTSLDDRLITFAQGEIGAVFQLDTESANMEEVDINGHKGMVSEKSSMSILFWSNEESSFYLTGDLEVKMLIEMAEKIEKK